TRSCVGLVREHPGGCSSRHAGRQAIPDSRQPRWLGTLNEAVLRRVFAHVVPTKIPSCPPAIEGVVEKPVSGKCLPDGEWIRWHLIPPPWCASTPWQLWLTTEHKELQMDP